MIVNKKVNFGSSAQGTIEYLVIVAVVVVISLVVVGLFVTLMDSPSKEITDSSSQVGSVAVGGISIIESVIDPEGDSLIRLSNNSSDAITLTKVIVGGVDNNFSEQLVGLDSKVFSLSSLNPNCPCSVGQKSVKCEMKIIYTTASGITQTEYRTINAQCVNVVTPRDENRVVYPIFEPDVVNVEYNLRNCIDLQNIKLDVAGDFQLMNDINCYDDTREGGALWNDGAGFEPIGSESECEDSYCSGQEQCENPIGCSNTWNTIAQCGSNSDICQFDQTYCEVECGGTYNEEIWTCENYTPIYCGDSESICEDLCYATWFEANTCQNERCSTQESCERTIGCGSTWNYNEFSGSINGNNFEIQNLYLSRGSISGLFGWVDGATIENVNLENITVLANVPNSECVGRLVGNNSYGRIQNNSANGTLIGLANVGGLVGCNSFGILEDNYVIGDTIGNSNVVGGLVGNDWAGEIRNNYVIGNTTSPYDLVGGLIGDSSSIGGEEGEGRSIIEENYVLGNTSGGSDVGGLVGKIDTANIIRNYVYGNVTGTGAFVNNAGGVAGRFYYGDFNDNYFVGNVTGRYNTGGLIGGLSVDAIVINNFSKASVTGYRYVGGFIGRMYNANTVRNNYSVGSVALSGIGSNYLGGFIGGYTTGELNNNWWYNSQNSCCGSGICTNCTKAASENSLYLPGHNVYIGTPTWSFVNTWVARDANYPILSWQ